MLKCPHYGCNREFHEAELTETVARFFDTHTFDADYSPDTDDSPIACIGSCNLGPARAPKYAEGGVIYWDGPFSDTSTWTLTAGYTAGTLKFDTAQWMKLINSWDTTAIKVALWDKDFNYVWSNEPKPCPSEPLDVTVPYRRRETQALHREVG